MDGGFNLDKIPKRHLSEVEKQYVTLKIEQLRLKREQNRLILEKGTLLFFAYMIFLIITFMNKMISKSLFSIMIRASIAVLLVSVVPYMISSRKQEKEIETMLDSLLHHHKAEEM